MNANLLVNVNAVINKFISDFNESESSGSSSSSSSSYDDSSKSTSSSSGEVDDELVDIAYICGSCIYFLMMVALIVIYINKYRQSLRVRWTYVSTHVTIIGLVFLVLRVAWCILSLRAINKYAAFVVNRVGQFLYLLIFGVLLFLVIDTAVGTTARTFVRQAFTGDLDFKFLSRPIKVGFWAFVGVASVIIVASLIESFLFPGKATWFKYSEVLLALIFFLYGALYIVFGVLLYRRLYDTSLPGTELFKILSYWVGIAVCFFVKAAQFILMVANVEIEQAVEIIVFYVVAELGPIGLYAWVTNGNVYHENLYYLPDKPVPNEASDKEHLIKIKEDDDDGIF